MKCTWSAEAHPRSTHCAMLPGLPWPAANPTRARPCAEPQFGWLHHQERPGKSSALPPCLRADEEHNGRRHLCADERNVGGKALGIPAGLSWRRHPWHGIASELKNDHGRWMGFTIFFQSLSGTLSNKVPDAPRKGMLWTITPLSVPKRTLQCCGGIW